MTIHQSMQGSFLQLTLDRPNKKNAITHQMYLDLTKGFEKANADPSILGIWLKGAGEDFTAGNDLNDFASAQSPADLSPVLTFIKGLPHFSKLLMITTQGHTVGIGVTLLAHADFVIAHDNTRFCMPFTQLGLCPEAGITYLLPRLAGRAQCSPYLLLSEPFTVTEAQKLGLITECESSYEAVELNAQAIIEKASSLSPAAMLASKALLKPDVDALEKTIARECTAFLKLLQAKAHL